MQFTSQKIKKITQEGNKSSIEFYDVPPMDNIPQIDDAVFRPKGKDTIPAMLTPGEAIIPAEAVDAYPDAVMRLIKAGRSIQDKRDSKVPLENPNIVDTNQNKIMQANHGGIAYANTGLSDMIKSYEGYSPNIYKDAANYAFGYGTNFYPSTYRTGVRNRVSPDNSQMIEFAPEEEKERFAENMLGAAIDDAEKMVDSLKLDLNEPQKEALTSSVYQMGIGTFKSNDKMIKALKDKNYDIFAKEFLNAGVTSQGKVIPGLVNRRKEELNYFFQEPAVSNPNVLPDKENTNPFVFTMLPDQQKIIDEQKNKAPQGMVIGPSGQLIYPSDYDFSKLGGVPHGNYIGPDGERFDTRIKNNIPSTYSGMGNMYYDEFGELYDASERMPSLENKYAGFRPDEINIPVVSGHSGDIGSILTPEQQLTQPINFEELLRGTETVLPIPESELGNVLEIPIINENITPVDDGSSASLLDSEVQLDNTESKNILKKLTDKTEGSVDNNVTPPSESEAKESSEKAPKGFIGNVLSKLNDILGRALDEEALAKMAVHYTGSRMLGYGHQGSLNYSAKVAVDAMEYNQKVVDAFIKKHGDDFEPASLAKYKKTHNLDDLIPINKTGIKKPVGYGFDNLKQIKIPKVELLNGKQAYLIDGKIMTYDQILDTYGSKRININYTSGDDATEIAKSFVNEAGRQFKRINRFITDKKLNIDAPFSQGSLADDMASYFTSLKSDYFIDESRIGKLRPALNRAANNYVNALIKHYEEDDPEKFPMPSFEGLANKELIAIPTAEVLSYNDIKNTSDMNTNLLIEQIEELIPAGSKDYTEIKTIVGGLKKAWRNSKNRFSYSKESAFTKIGWDAQAKWIYDMLTDPQEDTLKVAFTKESINKYLASNPRNDDLLVPIGDK